MKSPLTGKKQKRSSRSGFTLIEMLVVMIIILIISVFSYTAVSSVLEGDRVRGGARTIDSFLEGARNRAVHAGQVRGVRFLLDPNIEFMGDVIGVSSMIYIGAPKNYSQGSIQVTADNRTLTVPAAWTTAGTGLAARGLLVDGARIKIPDDTSGLWYTVSLDGANWKLNNNSYSGPQLTDLTYQLELAPGILPNQEPRVLPNGVCIDLDGSNIPSDWSTSGSAPYAASETMDILFAPDGNLIGTAKVSGLVHFVVADTRDVLNGRDPDDPNKEGDQFLVSINPLTGNIGVYPIDPADFYRYAEEGRTAK